ncbi:MAG: hypothetical protein UIB63_09865 [Methanobrevibacter sp.]|uniref:hypothetical protein n=1 Tax=Methanobrevibacter sp. TaxID=66852 RepID=UPI002E761946|nr:hypothetical protein [Methanobrevibacter sp.]MEE0943401.1 hypothetical protein [Methanobrevibacter sp.]
MAISVAGLVFTDVLGLCYLISKVIAAIIVMFWNFIARRVMFYGMISCDLKMLSVLCLCADFL